MLKPKRDVAEPPELVAKKVRARLNALDGEMATLDAFCALLKDLNPRPVVREPHSHGIVMVRAGILRGAIAAVMACLRALRWRARKRWRDSRPAKGHGGPSTGQRFPRRSQQGPFFGRVKRLRDRVAHNLVLDRPVTPVQYEDVFKLAEIAEGLVVQLFEACKLGPPKLRNSHLLTTEHAKTFWDTYFVGMRFERVMPGWVPQGRSRLKVR